MRISMERKLNTIHIRTKQWGGLFCLPLETEVNQISEMSIVIDWQIIEPPVQFSFEAK